MARVLIVDDDADLRDALAGILREEGHCVEIAKHGLQALEKLSTDGRPDIVLLDLLMPVMDGWTFLSRLRASSEHASLPVLVMSAGTRGAEEAAERGVRYLQKPLCVSTLLDVVARAERYARGRSIPAPRLSRPPGSDAASYHAA